MVLKEEMGIRTFIQFGLELEVFYLDLAALPDMSGIHSSCKVLVFPVP